jgi:hypothetical protein
VKLVITFKTPDAFDDALADCPCSPADATELKRLARQFFAYGEYADIELDTVNETATVLRGRR